MALGLDDLRIGTWTHPDGYTGCTVLLPPHGSLGACANRGAHGTREMALLDWRGRVEECHAIVLAGGSSLGLSAATGVVEWCEGEGIGYRKSFGLRGTEFLVPIVGAVSIMDLEAGPAGIDSSVGRLACESASERDPDIGLVGAGAGCTSKLPRGRGRRRTGQGYASARSDRLVVGALATVNPWGILPPEGVERTYLSESAQVLDIEPSADTSPLYGTAVCVVTNARLSKMEAYGVAEAGHDGIAAAFRPLTTVGDGNAVFCLSTGQIEFDSEEVARLAIDVVEAAIVSVKPLESRHADPD